EQTLDLRVSLGLIDLPGTLGELVEFETPLLGGGLEAAQDGLALGVGDADVRVGRGHRDSPSVQSAPSLCGVAPRSFRSNIPLARHRTPWPLGRRRLPGARLPR